MPLAMIWRMLSSSRAPSAGHGAECSPKPGVGHVRWHDLRHAHATPMLASGVHPKVVSERLGHASVGITLDTYRHVLPGLQAAAAEALDAMLAAPVEEVAQ
jgi:integrase